MLRVRIGIIAFCLLGAMACTSFKKLYNAGSVGSDYFYSEIDYYTDLELIFVPVEIGGETYRFLFDTGAPNVISKELGEKLALKSKRSGNVSDSQGNRGRSGVIKLDTVSIGGVDFYNTSAITADLKHAVELACLNFDGIIGANLMKLAYWKIDAKNQKLTFSSDLDTLKAGLSRPHILPFDPKNTYTPMVSLCVNDSVIDNFTFDTGSGGYISLGKNLSIEPENFLAEFVGYGSTGLYGSNLDTIRYGKVKVELDSLSQIGIAEYSMSHSKKLLGMEFLSQFVQILDWEKNEITLYDDSLVTQKLGRYPVSPRWVNGALIVGSINTDSIHQSLDLSIGDTITVLAGQNFDNVDVSRYCDLILLSDSLRSDTLKFELLDGTSRLLPRVTLTME